MKRKNKHLTPINAETRKWAKQKVVIECTMEEAGDLMDLLFMADGGPFDSYFKETLKLNHMTKAYNQWLNRMVNIVCPECSKTQKNKKPK